MNYELFTNSYEDSFFLGSVRELLDINEEIVFYANKNTAKINRKCFDGFTTFIGKIHGTKVGVVYNDFRTFGSSVGVNNSHRVGAFIDEMDKCKYPIIYLCNSIGVRVQDGRRVFKNSFTLVPKIKKFVESNLYITATLGYSLGLSAILYSLGDYRFALKKKSSFNLTGPDVFKKFFGQNVSFEDVCSGEVMVKNNFLVQELVTNQDSLFTKIRSIIEIPPNQLTSSTVNELSEQIEQIQSNAVEVYNNIGKSLKTYILHTEKGPIGIFLNPYKKSNMMTVKDLSKFRFALQLFRKLKLPICSLINTAGGDPRIEENNKNIARTLYDLSSDIIDYPYKKQGIVFGNCYGGSSLLTMPPFYGGEKIIVVNSAKIGIMDSMLIRTLLKSAPPLLDIWEKNQELETDEYLDFIEDELLSKIIPPSELIHEILNII